MNPLSTKRFVPLFLGAIIVSLCCSKFSYAQPAVEGYLNYSAFQKELDELTKNDLVGLSSLGETLGGRKVFLLTLTSGKTASAEAKNKPAILVVGNVSASHLAGSELAMRLAKDLVARAKDDAAVKKMLEEQVVYIIPRPTPDASEAFFTSPKQERNGNVRAMDDDRDGDVNEDPSEDLNKDGWITQIRVEDPTGLYIPHPSDPRLMIKADAKKNEVGRYSIYTEGIDNDKDEVFNEDGPGGVDFNKNFPYAYPYFKSGAGPHQVSEPETRAVLDFAFAHTNIHTVLVFSPQNNLSHAWKADSRKDRARIKTVIRSADATYFDNFRSTYSKVVAQKDAPGSAKGNGAFLHWSYFHYGRWAVGTPGWWLPKTAAPEPEKAKGAKDKKTESKKDADKKPAAKKKVDPRAASEMNALYWFKKNNIDGFVDWKEIKHPNFPGKKVEVGGFKPYLRTNPPMKELDAVAKKHTEFLLKINEKQPKLAIAVDTVEARGEGVYRIVVTLRNNGYLPTFSAMGSTVKLQENLQATLHLPKGAKLLTGHARVTIPVLKGNGGNRKQQWLVMLDKASKIEELKVTAGCITLGQVETKIKLPKE